MHRQLRIIFEELSNEEWRKNTGEKDKEQKKREED